MSSYEDLQRRIEQLTRENDRIQRENDQLQRETENTTLEEYLRACHDLVLTNVPKESIAHGDSHRGATAFFDTQKAMLQMLSDTVPKNARLFEDVSALRAIGGRVADMPVNKESRLAVIDSTCVGQPVRVIMHSLKNYADQQGRHTYPDVFFQTDASDLRDEEDTSNKDVMAGVVRDEELLTDQICAYRVSGDSTEIAYVVEYKAPHKLHTQHLEKGLREMDIYDQVVNKPTVPTEEPAKFQHYAELLASAAVTQAYHCMLESGLEFGYITNGDAVIFLKIDWTNTTELFYHLALSSLEVEADEDPIYANTVAQVLAFTLLAFDSGQHSDDERNAAVKASRKWEVGSDYILDEISREELRREEAAGPSTLPRRRRRLSPSRADWKPRPVKKVRRGPDEVVHRPVTRSRTRCGGDDDGGGRETDGDHDRDRGSGGGSHGGGFSGGAEVRDGTWNSGSGEQGSSASKSGRGGAGNPGGSRTRHSSARDDAGDGAGDDLEERDSNGRCKNPKPYCTPSCLLSLINGWPLDSKCPNVRLHARSSDDGEHPVSYAEWMVLLQKQLSQSVVKGLVNLRKQGGCGVLFQNTLLEYGYSFVAKGTTVSRIPALQKEEAVYRKLEALQGRHVPVCLGRLGLRPLEMTVFYDIGVGIVYFLLMSYGGTKLEIPSKPAARKSIGSSVARIADRMHSLGVAHGDIRLPNVLQGPGGRWTIVDFDQASILPTAPSSPVMATPPPPPPPPSKRRRLMDDAEELSHPDLSSRR
ncbi:Conserved hypothetical, protein [Geosmithia morbida]|uniref:Conserved hypothetical, protein n=1 Tax=Geosmithia morbida TaxID=1094350 RepID=A0A9P5D4N3_9HYPO|nr:Conserved hypothetical, protein [Geosmithia morbida]KAF4123721.1 Conserved hypothetical, protein [Geosmithia morbida]